MKDFKKDFSLDYLLHKMEQLLNETNKVDYDPSYLEVQKILKIKRYADEALKNIGYEK